MGFLDTETATADEVVDKPVLQVRKLIKDGHISFETSNIKETKNFVTDAAKDADGYISNENNYKEDDRITQSVVIRVPSDKFDQLLATISGHADRLESRSIDVQDVTEEYMDVQTRIRTKKELENRYREILTQAKTVDEILKIEKEIGFLRTEIESMEGRLKYLNDRIAFSTLTVEFYQPITSAFGFGSKFSQALARGWDLLLLFIIGLTHLWPFAILVIIGIYIYRLRRKKKKKEV